MLLTTNSQDEFQQEGSMDVRPFLDSEDGGSLDETSQPPIPIFFILLVSILVLAFMFQKILPIFSLLKRAGQKDEDCEQVFISDLAMQYSLSQDAILDYLNQLGIEVRSETKSKKLFIDANASKRFKSYANHNLSSEEAS